MAATGWRNWKTKLAKDILVAATAMIATIAPGLQSNMKETSINELRKPSSKPSHHELWMPSPPLPSRKSSADACTEAITIDSSLEYVMPNGVTIYGKPEAAEPLAQLLDEQQDLFIDQGQTVDIPEEEWMPIRLKPGATSKPARVYPVGQKDKEVVGNTFDKLHEQGKMYWSFRR